MPDDTSLRGTRDGSRIDVEQDYEVRDAMKAYAVTRDELEAAIRNVGTRRADVEAELRRAKAR